MLSTEWIKSKILAVGYGSTEPEINRFGSVDNKKSDNIYRAYLNSGKL